MTSKPVVTRFAPSPTGALHIGGARTALYAWAYARQHGGRFILRIEDTDPARSSSESTRGILRDLDWLGLHWDEGPDPQAADPETIDSQRGERGPYFQSQRREQGIYDEYIDQLLESGAAYEDDGAVRFRMDKDATFDDTVYGSVTVAEKELEDFVIRKGDGFPTYHLAVVVDDALMEVTHVIRGAEHLYNTTKHVALQDALGFPRPTYCHTPSIMNPDGSKMSKRDKAKVARQAALDAINAAGTDSDAWIEALLGSDHAHDSPDMTADAIVAFLDKENDRIDIADVIARHLVIDLPEIEIADFKASGYLRAVLLNYISLLGWNPGDDVEQFDVEFIVKHFSLDRVNKANSKFDRAKLLAFNGDAIRAMEVTDFARQMKAAAAPVYSQRFHDIIEDDEKLVLFASAYHERAKTLIEPFESGAFLVEDEDTIAPRYDFDAKPIRKAVLKGDPHGLALLRDFAPTLNELDDAGFGSAAHEAIARWCQQHDANMGKLAQPIRVAVSGGTVTPPIDLTLDMLGKQNTIARINRLLAEADAKGL